MKSDREFINGIYKKAELVRAQEKQTTILARWKKNIKSSLFRKKGHVFKYAMAAAVICMIPILAVNHNNKNETLNNQSNLSLASYEEDGSQLSKGRMIEESQNIRGKVLNTFVMDGVRYMLIRSNDARDLENSMLLLQGLNEGETYREFSIDEEIIFSGRKLEFSLSSDIEVECCNKFNLQKEELNSLDIYEVDEIK